ncbi:MAG TPA: peptide chain release factor N(5)-glutamine methyltransferase [Candidatus Omnitrophota bacterium]|nr:peptide chain release factor N(5)-glutamine methyltransferase [Candidatus Omnitrophota bacterium]HRZ14971.1 peptide chain release factor N(5)-glutamine methyltransferase [Candidatus Omnitrophota bacterium]
MNEAETVFTHLLACDRASLYLKRHTRLSAASARRLAAVLRRRIAGEPLDYILGSSEFMGLLFRVTPDVLIPRQDTEVLVETVLRLARRFHHNSRQSSSRDPARLDILDLGTGSGAIAVSLAHMLPVSRLLATDSSLPALRIAQENARRHAVDGRIEFRQCDLFPGGKDCRRRFQIIVSNPPYIPSRTVATLAPEVQAEPRRALDGGPDGLAFFRRIAQKAPLFLRPAGLLILEMGFDQKDRVQEIVLNQKKFLIKEVVKDYNSIQRVMVAQLRGRTSA